MCSGLVGEVGGGEDAVNVVGGWIRVLLHLVS
jgi:hypothetical protein